MEVSEILKNASDKNGFLRERYEEKSIPSSIHDVCVMPYFGDFASMITLSSILLRRFREEVKGSKYFILCSWPRMGGLFPYVDEYWSVSNDVMEVLYPECERMQNNNTLAIKQERNMNYFFSDVVTTRDLVPFYNNGLTDEFMKRFRHVKCFKPVLPSSVVLGKDFLEKLESKSGNKVVVYPSKFAYGYKNQTVTKRIPLSFWVSLIDTMKKWGMVPVIYQNHATYDLKDNSCIYLPNNDISMVLTAMRTVGCVLDIFSGISRFAIEARCPYVMCDERNRYNSLKEYEIDFICGDKIPKEFIFSFANVITEGYYELWSYSLFDAIRVKLESLFKDFNRNHWPSTSEQNEIVPYAKVKKRKNDKMGIKFIKIPRV